MSDNCYEIRDILNKGKGVFATRQIPRGSLIICEKPLFSLSSSKDIASALRSLTDQEKRQYLQLTNCLDKRLTPPLLGILRTNALSMGPTDPAGGMQTATKAGIFLICSRFNSSCVPNVNNEYNDKLEALCMYALRDIKQDEELCISYCGNLFRTRAERQQHVKSNFNFICSCDACKLEGVALENSDRRRKEIQKIFDEIPSQSSRPGYCLRLAKTALSLLKEEGILIYRDLFSYDAFSCCSAAANLALAKLWITKYLEYSQIARGEDCENIRTKYGKNPRLHPAWGIHRDVPQGLEAPDD